jgi:uncharacterized Zn-finger protein
MTMTSPTTARPAMQPPSPTETITVTDTTVACDGGGGALGHPRVFLTLVDGRVVCPYCSRIYLLSPAAGGKAA